MTAPSIIAIPAPYQARSPRDADIAAILALIAAFERAETGQVSGYTADDIRGGWENLDTATDAWLIEAPNGAMASYGEVTDTGSGQLIADGYVHPKHTGRGLGRALVRLMESRARALVGNAPEGARVIVANHVIATSRPSCDLLAFEGYTPVRYSYGMRIELPGAPLPPVWPAGVALRSFTPGRDERAVFETVEEAFADHWGHVPRTFEDWIKRTHRDDFDPTLWFLAEEAGELAGVVLCRARADGGWVNTLAVRRPWRRRGLGMALLLQAFGAFHQRGERRVGLGVDAASLTGATRLYERAGMRVAEQIARFEKELRPGVDLRTETLAE